MSDGAQLIKDLLIARGSGAGNQAGNHAGYLPQPAAPKGSKLQIYLYLFIVLPNVAQPFGQATCGVFSQRERNRKSARVASALRSLANETNGNETDRESERDRQAQTETKQGALPSAKASDEGKGEGDWRLSSELHHNLAVNTETHTHTHMEVHPVLM